MDDAPLFSLEEHSPESLGAAMLCLCMRYSSTGTRVIGKDNV